MHSAATSLSSADTGATGLFSVDTGATGLFSVETGGHGPVFCGHGGPRARVLWTRTLVKSKLDGGDAWKACACVYTPLHQRTLCCNVLHCVVSTMSGHSLSPPSVHMDKQSAFLRPSLCPRRQISAKVSGLQNVRICRVTFSRDGALGV